MESAAVPSELSSDPPVYRDAIAFVARVAAGRHVRQAELAPTRAKLTPYEAAARCFRTPASRSRCVYTYRDAVVIFDIQIRLHVPWAVTFPSSGSYGLAEMVPLSASWRRNLVTPGKKGAAGGH